MPLWPFGRKKRRTSTSNSSRLTDTHGTSEKTPVSEAPRHMMATATQTPPRPPSSGESDSNRKRKSALATAPHTTLATVSHDQPAPVAHPLRNTSVQDITALPGLRQLDASPHLRPANTHKPVIPYNLDRPSPRRLPTAAASTSAAASVSAHPQQPAHSPALGPRQSKRTTTTPQRKTSKRSTRRREQELRAEHVRAMTSSPTQIPKRPAAVNNDLLRRDSKKARRTLSKPRPDDPRGSNVSLPASVPSSMSARSEQRGWQVGGIDLFSPRPTVRLSHPAQHHQPSSATTPSRNGSKKGKLPAIAQESSRRDRRRIADLADDLDSTDLRTLLERDARRQEQKMSEQHERLERKLRKRAEKQRAEEQIEREAERADAVERERDLDRRTMDRIPPTAVHPAFRDQSEEGQDAARPMTPTSMHEEAAVAGKEQAHESRDTGGTYLNYPARQDIPQNPFSDPEPEASPFADPQGGATEAWSPVQTPMEEPVLGTARAVRLSQGHMSPPTSPVVDSHPASSLSELSDLHTQRTSSLPRPLAQQQRRPSESSTRRAGTWASIFRRGPSTSRTSIDNSGKPSPSESSFANVSRESMSRQAIPAHLVKQPSRSSATPARTQSRFREDLPDVPLSPPDSRVQSPDLSIAAAHAAAARRAKHGNTPTDFTQISGASEPVNIGRTDSPVVSDVHGTNPPLSQSLASVDSEGSWISGRPQRHSTRRLQRDSAGSAVSMEKATNDFTASYERLPVPEHEYFNSLTPNAVSRRASSEAAPPSGQDTTPTPSDAVRAKDDTTPVRHGTAHRHPTVIHNEPRFKSREGLVAEFMASGPLPTRSTSGSDRDSLENSPIEQSSVQKATSVNYGHIHGHAKSVSAGSAKLLNISRGASRRTSPASGSPAIQQSEF